VPGGAEARGWPAQRSAAWPMLRQAVRMRLAR
jgi:hypothetical protein